MAFEPHRCCAMTQCGARANYRLAKLMKNSGNQNLVLTCINCECFRSAKHVRPIFFFFLKTGISCSPTIDVRHYTQYENKSLSDSFVALIYKYIYMLIINKDRICVLFFLVVSTEGAVVVDSVS